MRHANRPAGPGKPTNERKDEATTREEIEEVEDRARGNADAGDTTRGARHAERDAHVKSQDHKTSVGTGRDKRR